VTARLDTWPVRRIAAADSPAQCRTTDFNLFCATDTGPITILLPPALPGMRYRIVNTGASGNAVTLTPHGSQLLLGFNSNYSVTDGAVLIIAYEATEGWW